jgi:peptidyl-prolyl cis-trans isomerase D
VAKLIFDLEKPGAVPPDVIPLENGYAVAVLKEKTSATDQVWEDEGEFYWMSMRAAKQRDALDKYVKALREDLSGEVKVNQAVVGESDAKEGDGEPAP